MPVRVVLLELDKLTISPPPLAGEETEQTLELETASNNPQEEGGPRTGGSQTTNASRGDEENLGWTNNDENRRLLEEVEPH